MTLFQQCSIRENMGFRRFASIQIFPLSSLTIYFHHSLYQFFSLCKTGIKILYIISYNYLYTKFIIHCRFSTKVRFLFFLSVESQQGPLLNKGDHSFPKNFFPGSPEKPPTKSWVQLHRKEFPRTWLFLHTLFTELCSLSQTYLTEEAQGNWLISLAWSETQSHLENMTSNTHS